MKDAVDAVLREEQSGFRPTRSCTDAIFSLRTIIEKTIAYQIPIYMHFIDFRKAFDSIHRDNMWKIMTYYGIPEKYVRLLKEMYNGTKCCVRLEQGTTNSFEVETGVRQAQSQIQIDFHFLHCCHCHRSPSLT